MATLLLSGVGGTANWLPLIAPLAAIVIVLYTGDLVIKFVKKRRLHKQEEQFNELNSIDTTDKNFNNPNS